MDPFSIDDPAEFAVWLKKQLPGHFHKYADTLQKEDFEGEGFKNTDRGRLEQYGLSKGAADKIIAIRDKFRAGTRVFVASSSCTTLLLLCPLLSAVLSLLGLS